ncbi:MAG: hypothetical protein IJC95_02085 [Clostridia bacterium]|nr:hypothetical protein [Clostridia bacterium]
MKAEPRVRLSLFLSKPQAWYGINSRSELYGIAARPRMASPKVHFCGLIPYDAPHRFHTVFDGFHATLRVDFMHGVAVIKYESEEDNYGKKTCFDFR